jgi:hypothetical protein
LRSGIRSRSLSEAEPAAMIALGLATTAVGFGRARVTRSRV